MALQTEERIKYIDEYSFAETVFNSRELAKTESIMCLGNGYLGLRSCAEESYIGQSRGLFIAGTFNKFDENEVTELPNCPDFIGTEIQLGNEFLDLSKGELVNYEKKLSMKNGLLTRKADWEAGNNRYSLEFSRFVSHKDLHAIGQKITICSEKKAPVRIVTGINARMTNSGSQHFTDGDKRFIDKKYLQMVVRTTQSRINVFLTLAIKVLIDGKEIVTNPNIMIDRRRMLIELVFEPEAFQSVEIEKIIDVRTDRDIESSGLTSDNIKRKAQDCVKDNLLKGYSAMLRESAEVLDKKLWSRTPVKICGSNSFDQLAVNFAQYHLLIMTPAHDSRMNIGAKGLSGEGYKGHTFWDTEIFALPYFILSNPEAARKLVEYRYLSLDGARKKARGNGYEGAQFPWESAWLDDGEVTPEWGPADVVTGLPLKIESGFIEQHITSDVAYGVWQYCKATGDEQFMLDCGYELIFETALFWVSRLEFNKEDRKYHINDVMGPDEYKEHVDDNAFTNYMAWWNIKLAIYCHDILMVQNKELFEMLDKKLNLKYARDSFLEKADKIFLPETRKDSVLPQDKTYLSLKTIDLKKYKNSNDAGAIYKDFNSEQISKIQVSKQADVMLLLLLLEDLFPIEVKKASWAYYEPLTIHGSSLSLSTHAILACDMTDTALAYSLFKRACLVDLGSNMHSSDDGIHAAAMAGIWQSAVFGFAGVRMLNGELRIMPDLPNEWDSIEFILYWLDQRLEICISHSQIGIMNKTNNVPIKINVIDETIYFDGGGKSTLVTKNTNLIKAVIFDLDGVIVSTDSLHYKAWKRVADEEGICFDETDNNRLRGVSRMESLEIILERSARQYTHEEKASLADRKNSYYVKLLAELTPDNVLPGVETVLAKLKRAGIKIAIGSSSKNTGNILKAVGLTGTFDAVVDGNEIKHCKPDPEVFSVAAEKLGIPPENCIVVEDAVSGIEAAVAAGMTGVAVGAAKGCGLARYCLDSIDLLMDIVKHNA